MACVYNIRKPLLLRLFRSRWISQRTASSYEKKKELLKEEVLRYLENYHYFLMAVEAFGVPTKTLEKFEKNGGVRYGESFSSRYSGWRFEWCYSEESKRPYRSVSSRVLFRKGYEALEQYATGQELHSSHVPAFEALERFYISKEKHELSLRLLKTAKVESTIASLLAQHLLSQLIFVQSNYFLDKFLDKFTKDKPDGCPCKCGKPIHFGSTELGSSLLFYGQADIVLFPTIKDLFLEADESKTALFTIEKKPDDIYGYKLVEDCWNNSEELASEDISMGECKLKAIGEQDYRQIFKQAISASICKRKKILNNNKNNTTTSMVPVCAITKKSYTVVVYDAENDYLLKMLENSMPIFKGDNLQFSTVIDLWLLIHHSLFCTQPSEKGIEMIKGTCNLIPQLGQKKFEVILKNSKWFYQREHSWNSKLSPPKLTESITIE